MNLEKYIPFETKKFRPYQKEVIESIINKIDDGVETILLNAPVGSGKSLIGYCVAKYLEEEYGDKSYIYTKTTYLQDQYLEDFNDLKTAMGRQNFKCLMGNFDETCDIGQCKVQNKYRCPVGAVIDNGVSLKKVSEPFTSNCHYWQQKYDAIQNNVSILNYPYAIADNMYLHHFDFRRLGIFDEGHSLESVLMSAFEVEITDYQLKNDISMDLVVKANIEEWIDELYKFADGYDKAAQKIDDEDFKRKERFLDRSETLKQTALFLEDNPSNWVFNVFKRKNPISKRMVNHVVFKPIQIQEYTDVLFGNVQQKLIMSGSILKADIFVDELGLDVSNYSYIEIPAIVPIENRKIVRDYVGSMSQKNFNSNFPFLVSKIKEIADNHLFEKGIIHTFTYNINYQLFKAFKSDDRFIFHTQRNRVEKTKEFKELPDDEGAIFVSPYSYEGVDFPYNQARWQIICKNPYPYLGDSQVKARMEMDRVNYTTDWGWINRQIALVLSQMYGRTNRAADDKSITYILDSDVERNFGPASLVTDYFLEALEGYHYTTPLKIVDEGKIKSRGANRENQKEILKDIKGGLNTLESLRKAYKQLPSSSYVEVKKAVDYLLKCGAIAYSE